ncbi:thermitase [Cyclonatronum proteinivorum]|uniref:Thermitase n=1 Tax=Cyclonatronum proteinivorum TaxID=1457365 RepID=A0A345UNV2_9BACT|nr:thermitase [Cyclonatronum proteinivorum]
MKNKLKNRRFRISVCCWILLFMPYWITSYTLAQSVQADQAIPGLINVKFTSETLVESKSTLQSASILNPEIRNVLETRGFERGERIFPYFESSDTLSVSKRTGEQVVLLDLSGWYTIQVADTVNINRLAGNLMGMPGIEAASPEYIFELDEVFPDDPNFLSNDQWGLYNFTNPGNDIHAPQAWEFNTGRSDVTIAVIDGGIDHNHADLDPGDRNRIIMGLDVTTFPIPSTNTMDDIPAGSVGADHGTAVAGIIGAITDNGLQVAGVMWDVKILPVKVIHSSGNHSIQQSHLANGVYFATAQGVDIINMSMSSGASSWWQFTNPLTEASLNAYRSDILFIGSAGNNNSSTVRYPAGFPWVMAIGATDEDDIKTDVSNFGSH